MGCSCINFDHPIQLSYPTTPDPNAEYLLRKPRIKPGSACHGANILPLRHQALGGRHYVSNKILLFNC